MRVRRCWCFVVVAPMVLMQSAPASPPNVVVVLLDDAGMQDFGCYGSRYHRTPAIDRLAAAGTRWANAYAACPVCSPTRAALMTGLYPQRFGLTDWLPGRADQPGQLLRRPPLPPGLPLKATTLAETLRQAGYATGFFGKWHLGGTGLGPTDQGFEVNIGGSHLGHPPRYFAPFAKQPGQMPGLEETPPGRYLTDELTRRAIDWISQPRQKPFFLMLSHYAPHTPLQAKPEVIQTFEKKPAGQQGNPTYAAMLVAIDESIRDLTDSLKQRGLWDNTLFIFTSDNGGLATLEGLPHAATFNGPFREGKGYLYEGGLRVPLLITGPGVPAGQVQQTAVSTIDLAPTILDYCGLSASSGHTTA